MCSEGTRADAYRVVLPGIFMTIFSLATPMVVPNSWLLGNQVPGSSPMAHDGIFIDGIWSQVQGVVQIRSPHSACFARWLWRRSWRRCDGGEPDHPEGFEALSSSDQCGRVDVKTCIHVLCWNLLLICSFMMSSGLLTYYSRYIGNQWFQTLNQCVREVIGQWPPPRPRGKAKGKAKRAIARGRTACGDRICMGGRWW